MDQQELPMAPPAKVPKRCLDCLMFTVVDWQPKCLHKYLYPDPRDECEHWVGRTEPED